MFGVDNTMKVLIGKNIATTSTVQITDPGTTSTYIADGEIVILGTNYKATGGTAYSPDTPVANTTDVAGKNSYFRFCQRSGDKLTFSPYFTVDGITNAVGATHSGPFDQVTTLGYNGSTGSITVANNNLYEILVTPLHEDKLFSEQLYRRIYPYTSSTSDTQPNIAATLTGLINNDPAGVVKAERTGDGTFADWTGTGSAVKLTKGSKTAEFYYYSSGLAASTGTTAIGDIWNIPSSGGRSFTIANNGSDYLKIYIGTTVYGGSTDDAAAVVTLINAGTQATASGTTTITITYNDCFVGPPPVTYNVSGSAYILPTIVTGDSVPTKYVAATAASTAASFTLDQAYTGETGFFPGGATVATNAGVASAAPTNYGIKLTGLPLTYKKKGLFPYNRVLFETTLLNFGTTLVTATQAMVLGTGVYGQVADMEWFALGGDGVRNYMWHPIPEGREDAISCHPYDVVSINYVNTEKPNVISGSKPSAGAIYLFLDKTYFSGTHQETTLKSYLNSATLFGLSV